MCSVGVFPTTNYVRNLVPQTYRSFSDVLSAKCACTFFITIFNHHHFIRYGHFITYTKTYAAKCLIINSYLISHDNLNIFINTHLAAATDGLIYEHLHIQLFPTIMPAHLCENCDVSVHMKTRDECSENLSTPHVTFKYHPRHPLCKTPYPQLCGLAS